MAADTVKAVRHAGNFYPLVRIDREEYAAIRKRCGPDRDVRGFPSFYVSDAKGFDVWPLPDRVYEYVDMPEPSTLRRRWWLW